LLLYLVYQSLLLVQKTCLSLGRNWLIFGVQIRTARLYHGMLGVGLMLLLLLLGKCIVQIKTLQNWYWLM
jgi:hypothetical protein